MSVSGPCALNQRSTSGASRYESPAAAPARRVPPCLPSLPAEKHPPHPPGARPPPCDIASAACQSLPVSPCSRIARICSDEARVIRSFFAISRHPERDQPNGLAPFRPNHHVKFRAALSDRHKTMLVRDTKSSHGHRTTSGYPPSLACAACGCSLVCSGPNRTVKGM